MHHHGPGWGCVCPLDYIGAMEMSPDDTPFLEPPYEATATQVGPLETRIVEGYFTGTTSPVQGDYTKVYTLLGFRVLRTRVPSKIEPGGGSLIGEVSDADARVMVVSEGSWESPPPADGKNFLVLDMSFPMGGNSADLAHKRADKFRAQYPSIDVVDSRTVPGLFCCNWVVVLGRFATEIEASAEARKAKAAGVAATIRRGW
jgi:hypothetical protein